MKLILSMLAAITTILLCGTTQTFALEFKSIGIESASTGGAGVAYANGSSAAYYNPALLARNQRTARISLSAGIGFRENGIVRHIDALADININDTLDELEWLVLVNAQNWIANQDSDVSDIVPPLVRSNITTIKNELKVLSRANQNGIRLTSELCLGMQYGNYGIGVFGITEWAGHAVIDPNRYDVIFKFNDNSNEYYAEYNEVANELTLTGYSEYYQRSLEYALENERTYISLSGLEYYEIPIAYGSGFDTRFGKLCIGGALKIMPGRVVDYDINIDTASDNIADVISDNLENDSSYGYDLGLLFTPSAISNFSVGIVAKNINTPAFTAKSGKEFELPPQVRAGIAYAAGKRVTYVCDIDLTKNETFIPDYDSQNIGGGLIFQALNWLTFSGGIMHNLQESSEGTIFTAGMGVGAPWFEFNLALQLSNQSGEFEGNSIPKHVNLQLTLRSTW